MYISFRLCGFLWYFFGDRGILRLGIPLPNHLQPSVFQRRPGTYQNRRTGVHVPRRSNRSRQPLTASDNTCAPHDCATPLCVAYVCCFVVLGSFLLFRGGLSGSNIFIEQYISAFNMFIGLQICLCSFFVLCAHNMLVCKSLTHNFMVGAHRKLFPSKWFS